MDSNSLRNKKNKGFFNVLFSRISFVILLLIVQIAIIVFMYLYLKRNFVPLHTLLLIIAFLVVIYISNTSQKSEYKLAWLLPVVVLPVFGCLYYIFTRVEFRKKLLHKNLNGVREALKPFAVQNEEIFEKLKDKDQEKAHLAYYLGHEMGYPLYGNTEVKYLDSGEIFFEDMISELNKAEKFIFMEFFIVSDGYMWDTVYEILKRKAKEGVEVRFLCDGTNVFSNISYRLPKSLESDGINGKIFCPPKPIFSSYQNNRDHRKICVIDGKTGYTGGANLADEYINRKERFGHWKDSAVKLTGSAVKSLTMMFLETWNVDEKDPGDLSRYFESKNELEIQNDGFVIPYGDNPFDEEYVGERVYFNILEHAKNYVHIMTPYLILDDEMLDHMKYAARSGVEVIIIMPHIPDKKYAFNLAKTYYEELIDSGVQIYEYTPGFVHSKVFVSDDETAVVGTINCDFRSLFLHFECGTYIYNDPAVYEAEKDFSDTLKKCRKISVADCRQRSFFSKISGRILRLFAPLL